MTATTASRPRIVSLDIVRGYAVMGILAMNIIAFALPMTAYMNPTSYGMDSPADLASWVFGFIFVDGKMRGLFSFLFGASMLLVIELARSKERNAAAVHYRRMFWLALFGLGHYYLIWWGDILFHYAVIGMLAWFFRNRGTRALVGWAAGFLVLQVLLMGLFAASTIALGAAASEPGAAPELVAQWQEMKQNIGIASATDIGDELALYGGGYAGILAYRTGEAASMPFQGLAFFGAETLAYFLLGMAALKSGFLTGEWTKRAYRTVALVGFAVGIPTYGLLAWMLIENDFSVPMIVALGFAATIVVRPAMIYAFAALILLLSRPGRAFTERVAAAGRAAFTNYIGTSIVMTFLFYGYGLGLFGQLTRIELWLPVVAMWALMLIWSKPWLERWRYGPFEWLWRSLARWRIEPLRKPLPAAAE
ncbi:MAG: DUF418 domain-containing protein [Sphingomonadaceae bacterium]